MVRTIRDMLIGAFLASFVGVALAAVGTPPGTGPALVDGAWLNGLAGGQNYSYEFGLTAAGSTHADSLQLKGGIRLYELDTVGASTGVSLPACLQGMQVAIYNNGASTVAVYPQIRNNPVTAAQDTINNGTTLSGGMATHTMAIFMCAKNGVWGAK